MAEGYCCCFLFLRFTVTGNPGRKTSLLLLRVWEFCFWISNCNAEQGVLSILHAVSHLLRLLMSDLHQRVFLCLLVSEKYNWYIVLYESCTLELYSALLNLRKSWILLYILICIWVKLNAWLWFPWSRLLLYRCDKMQVSIYQTP